MTKLQKLLILEKIQELDKTNIDIINVNGLLFNYLIKATSKEVRQAYDRMISNRIPF